MNQHNDQPQSLETRAIQPIALWLTSFDYVFGFQLKLMQDYWGISADRRR